jgi:HSP20 family protein
MAGFLSKLTGGDEEELKNEEESFERDVEYSVEDIGSEIEEISLGADLYEDEDNLYVKVFIAGVNPKELEMDVSRDILTISGERYDFEEKNNEQYIQRELSWGKFRKKILLPKEVDIELVEASIKYGVLTLKLPKNDKDRKVKIKL